MHRCFHWEIIDNTTGERNKYSAAKIDKRASPTRELLVSNLRIVLHFFLLERYFCFSFLFFFLFCDRLRNKKLQQLSREQIYDNRTVDQAKCLGLSYSFFIRFKTTGGGGGTSYGIIYRLLNMREMYQRINDGIFYESQKFKSKI